MTRTSQQAKPFEIRDPVHGFISLDETERRVLDSRPMQRLKHIHQLALTYQVYPGATHKRFEHSLGVMELAGRAFDVLTRDGAVSPFGSSNLEELQYWRKVTRVAALCHDLGHMPFSHAAESLLPKGLNHEQISRRLIESDVMRTIWETGRPQLVADDIAKLALGPREYLKGGSPTQSSNLTDRESFLSQIITGDTFGVDRMDYLLRDSHHLGVAYGRFDHERLIRMLRSISSDQTASPARIGIEEGGIHSAEGMLNARYFMFMQVYYHRARVAYDHHLECFLRDWLLDGEFTSDLEAHLQLTDNEVTVELARSACDSTLPGHRHAKAIMEREHFRELFYARENPEGESSEPIDELCELCLSRYGDDVCVASKPVKFAASQATVLRRDGTRVAFDSISDMAPARLATTLRFILIDPKRFDDAKRWIGSQRRRLGLGYPKE